MSLHATHPSLAGAAAAFAALAQALTAIAPSPRRVAQARAEVQGLLAGEREIRLFVGGTKNFGHQAASLDTLNRILELTGFRGDVCIVYADYGRTDLGATADKLSFLLQQPVDRRLDAAALVHPGGARLRFLPYERRNSLTRSVRFGFTGGADDMAVNFAAELRVDWFLRLQPFLWDDEADQKRDPYYESSRIEARDGRMFYLVDAWPPLRALPIRRATPPRDHLIGADPRADSFIAGLVRAGYALWPIYGLHHFRSLTHDVAFNLAVAALFLSARTNRSIALVSFCPLGEELNSAPPLAALKRALTPGGDAERVDSAPVAATLAALPRPAHFAVAQGHQALPIPSSAEASVVLIQLGPVAPALFEAVLQSAPLPPVVEGQVTANLMLNLGRPYLHILRPEHVIKNAYVSGIAAPGREALAAGMNQTVQRIVRALPSDPTGGPVPAEDLADLVLRLIDRATAEARYFVDLQRWLEAQECDKLFLGLSALHQAANAG